MINPPVFRSFIRQSESLYQNIHSSIKDRSGVFTSIEKNSEIVVKKWTKFKQYTFSLDVIPEVKIRKLWKGIRESIPGKYKVRNERYTKREGRDVFEAQVYYKSLLFCSLAFREGVGRGYPPAVSYIPPKYVERKSEKTRTSPRKQYAKGLKSKVAFVIDDVGYNRKYEDLLFSLPQEVTVSILPRLSYSEYFSNQAYLHGHDVMLHLPLEAENSAIDPGPGTIRVSMKPKEVERIIEENLASVPNAVGTNNHMGSKVTADKNIMKIIINTLKRKNIFFLDSVTSQYTVVRDIVEGNNLQYIRRDVFLDNNNDPEYIKRQIEQLARVAKQNGSAIGIGHYRRNTLRTISELIPQLQAQGIELVRVRDLIGVERRE